ncbi:hypothetical protein G6O67_001374 [Ophiocordyceps sinensis]|uniref:Uncharacterized protein n=1 Tax=Ophiocordyceps sinensis TaxID=72228 RepID=A0A8H4PXA7_9HYPO|nr:hypothetical protein G6O67_001374 [Ophiocordyceps sinensis]
MRSIGLVAAPGPRASALVRLPLPVAAQRKRFHVLDEPALCNTQGLEHHESSTAGVRPHVCHIVDAHLLERA